MRSLRLLISVTLPALSLVACSRQDGAAQQLAQAPSQESAPPQPLTACAMVTQAEMSKILGAAVTAEAHEGTTDQTECIYMSKSGPSPYVDFMVVRGDGEAAMTAAGMMGNSHPDLASPYAGIGDQAVAVGPGLMIRTGEDLVKLMFSGVDDAPAKAKLIFNTAKPRM